MVFLFELGRKLGGRNNRKVKKGRYKMLVKMIQFINDKVSQTIIWDCEEIHYGELSRDDIKKGDIHLMVCKGTDKGKSTMFSGYLPGNCIIYVMNDRGDTIDKINRLKKQN